MPSGVYQRNPALRPQTFKNCLQCGVRFGPVDHLKVKFCSPECRISGLRGQPNRKRGQKFPHLRRAATRQCLCCKAEFRATKDTQRRKQVYCSHRCYLRNRRVSGFETRVMELVSFLGVPVERSAKIGRWTFDARIIGTNFLIEADGKFWHSSAKVQERDARKDAWCAANGYEIVRVPELPFYANPMKAIDVILARWEKLTGKTAEKA